MRRTAQQHALSPFSTPPKKQNSIRSRVTSPSVCVSLFGCSFFFVVFFCFSSTRQRPARRTHQVHKFTVRSRLAFFFYHYPTAFVFSKYRSINLKKKHSANHENKTGRRARCSFSFCFQIDSNNGLDDKHTVVIGVIMMISLFCCFFSLLCDVLQQSTCRRGAPVWTPCARTATRPRPCGWPSPSSAL